MDDLILFKEKKCNFLLYSNKNENDNLVNQIISTVEIFTFEHSTKQADVFDLFNLLYPLENKNSFKKFDENIEFIITTIKQNIQSYELDDLTMIKHVLLVDFKSDTNTPDFPKKLIQSVPSY